MIPITNGPVLLHQAAASRRYLLVKNDETSENVVVARTGASGGDVGGATGQWGTT